MIQPVQAWKFRYGLAYKLPIQKLLREWTCYKTKISYPACLSDFRWIFPPRQPESDRNLVVVAAIVSLGRSLLSPRVAAAAAFILEGHCPGTPILLKEQKTGRRFSDSYASILTDSSLDVD